MAARRADLVGEFGAENVAPRRSSSAHAATHLISRASAFACSPNDTMRATPASLARRLRCANCAMSRLSTAAPPGSTPKKISALASAILASEPKKFEMHRRDRGDDRDMRADQPRQRLDLAFVVHAHLEHGIARARRTARERQRHAPMIVVGGDRGVGLAVLRQREPQRFLGAGLADRAGDADHLGAACARAPRRRERASPRAHRARPAAARRPANCGAPVDGDDRKAGLGCKRRGDEIMAVAIVARDGEERVARLDACGCRSRAPISDCGSAPCRSAPIAAAIASTVHSAGALMRRAPSSAAATAS